MAQKLYSCPTWPVYSLDQLKSEKSTIADPRKGRGESKKRNNRKREKKNQTKKKQNRRKAKSNPCLLSKICLNEKRKYRKGGITRRKKGRKKR